MMDIYCPRCLEPTDMDYIHDVVADRRTTDPDVTYDTVAREFRRIGCPAIGTTCNTATMDDERSDIVSMTYDLLGDDMDGAAALLDDLSW